MAVLAARDRTVRVLRQAVEIQPDPLRHPVADSAADNRHDDFPAMHRKFPLRQVKAQQLHISGQCLMRNSIQWNDQTRWCEFVERRKVESLDAISEQHLARRAADEKSHGRSCSRYGDGIVGQQIAMSVLDRWKNALIQQIAGK